MDLKNTIILFCFKSQEESSDQPGTEKKVFLLGIQTEFQQDMFVRWARKLVCVDAPHGTNAYDFQLVTVLVIDDYDEGIPVAWLISNKESADVLWVFFTGIRERCWDPKTEVFMSDDTKAYHNAWVAPLSMHDKNLLCSLHIDRSW